MFGILGEHSDGELQVGAGGAGREGQAAAGEGAEVPGGDRGAWGCPGEDDRQGGGVEEEGSRVGHCQGEEAL